MKKQPPSLRDLKPLRQPPTLMNPPRIKTLIQMNPSQPQDEQIRQTPHFIYHQPVAQSPRKNPLSKNMKSLHSQSLVSVNSINLQETVPVTQNSEMETRPINFIYRDTQNRPTLLNQYLSVTSFPDEFQYRPSKNSINRIQHHNSFEQSNIVEKCRQCDYEGEMDTIYKMGWVAWSWMVFLILSTIVLFFVPLVVKSFQEKQLICPQCGYKVKTQTPTCL